MFHNYKYGSQFSTLKNAAFNDRIASLFQIPDSGVGGGGRGGGVWKHVEKKMRETRVGARIDGQCSLFRCSLAFFSLLHQPTSSRTERLSKAIIALELTAVTVLLDLLKL